MYALYIDALFQGKGDKVKQNTENPPFCASTLKKIEGPGVKLQNYTAFVRIPYILILLVIKRVIRDQRPKFEATDISCMTP